MSSTFSTGARMLFGVFLLVFGINKFIGFLPMPAIAGDGGTLMGIYATSGFMKIIGVLEILGGLALLVNKFVPLALTISVAIMVNAFIFHMLHDPAGIGGAAVGLILGLLLVWNNKEHFAPLLRA